MKLGSYSQLVAAGRAPLAHDPLQRTASDLFGPTGAEEAALPLVRFAKVFGNDIAEDAGVLKLRLVLSEASDQTVTAVVRGPDFREGDLQLGPRTVTFAPGQTTATVKFKVVDDDLYEGSEVFKYEITSAANATIDRSPVSAGYANEAYGHIRDDDAPAGPMVRFARIFGNDVAEDAGHLKLRLTLSEPVGDTVTAVVAGPSFREGDMQLGPRTVTFAPGQTTATVKFKLVDDDVYEGDEVFKYEITSATNATVDLSDVSAGRANEAYGHILDDDAPEAPSLPSAVWEDFVA